MADPRVDYILSTLSKLLAGQATEKEIQEQIGDKKEITSFLDDGRFVPLCANTWQRFTQLYNLIYLSVLISLLHTLQLYLGSVKILRVTCTAGETTVLKFSNELTADPKDDVTAEASFVKLKPEAVSKDDFASNVLVSSLNGSPVQSLYHALHGLYAPLLLTNSGWTDFLDRKSQKLLAELEDSLGNVVRRGTASGTENIHSELAIASILTPTDEFKLWDSLTSVRKYSEIANVFNDNFEQVAPRFAKLKDLNLSDVIELIDETQNVLDDVWKAEVRSDQRYPQARMVKLPHLIFSL